MTALTGLYRLYITCKTLTNAADDSHKYLPVDTVVSLPDRWWSNYRKLIRAAAENKQARLCYKGVINILHLLHRPVYESGIFPVFACNRVAEYAQHICAIR